MSEAKGAWRQPVFFLRLGGGSVIEPSGGKGISGQWYKQWMEDVCHDGNERWHIWKFVWKMSSEAQDRRAIGSL